MFNVTKADGSKQPFDKNKIVRTCLRMRLDRSDAEEIADKIESKVYDGVSTKQILKMIFNYTSSYRPQIKHQIDLREAVSMMRPKPDFEQFIGLLLKADGYQVKTNQIISGNCIEHEIDVIAVKNNEKIYVEVKHHYQPHTYTGVDVFLETNSTFEDLIDAGNNFSKAVVVTNGKISEHAERYASCKNIGAIGWSYPNGMGLAQMIERHRFYPVTLIKGVNPELQAKLGDNGIFLLQQLVKYDANNLVKMTKFGRDKIKEILRKAEAILG